MALPRDEFGLTPRVRVFCDQWLIHRNGTKAAEHAGFSKKSATSQAARLLTNDNVNKYLTEKMKTLSERLGITAEYVLMGTRDIAEKTRPIGHESNPSVSLKAFDQLAKHLKLYGDDDNGGKANLTINLIKF